MNVKKGFIIGGSALAGLLIILTTIPLLFRDTLLEKTKSTLNRNLNADINFSSFNLSLLRNFPKASLALGDLIITGRQPFQGDTLFYAKSVRTRVGIFDLVSPGNLTIQDLIFVEPYIQLLVNAENRANWDIIPESAPESATPAKEEESSFGMELKKISIDKGNLRYFDATMPMEIRLGDINLGLKGKLYGNDTRMEAEGVAEQFDIVYDSVAYVKDVRLTAASVFDINFDKWLFQFAESQIRLNDLPVKVMGSFAMPDDRMDFDLSFESADSDMEKFLAFVPAAYQSYLKDLKASGQAHLSGFFKGVYLDEEYPALLVKVKLSDGNFRYAGLPEEINKVRADLAINKPQGAFGLTTVEISDAHAEIRNTPVDFSLKLANLMEDIQFGGRLKGKLDFDVLKEAIPMDSLQLSGLADVNIGVNGSMSAIEKSDYSKLKTDGTILLDNFSFQNYQMNLPVTVSTGKLDFRPDAVTLEQMQMKIGQSDLAVTGQVRDYYPWMFTDGTLAGNITLQSGYLNLNELMTIQKEEGKEKGKGTGTGKDEGVGGSSSTVGDDGAAVEAFEVPERVNLLIATDIGKALYDKMNITDISGRANINDGRMNLDGLTMRVMDGQLTLAGSYYNTRETIPAINMTVDMISLDIPTAFQSLKLIRNYLPIAAQSKGKFTTRIQLTGHLDENMQLIPSSLNGNGLLNTMNVQILNSPVFNKIKSVLNEEKLRDLRIDDLAASFTIANGNLLLKPFKTKISGQEATFSGRLSVDNLLNMDIAFAIQRDALSKNIEQTLALIPGQKNIQVIPVGVNLKGPVNNPDVKIDLDEAKSLVKKEFREATREDIQKTINKVGEGLKKLIR